MWLLAGLRLLLPFSLTDVLGLHLPSMNLTGRANAVYQMIIPDIDITSAQIANNCAALSPAAESVAPAAEVSTAPPSVFFGRTLSVLWVAGAAAVALCVAAGYVKLRLRLRTAVRMDTDIYQSKHIPTPFVLGLVHPRIYIPYSVADGDIPFVLEHEKNHIKRNDHITKAAALAVH